MIGRNVDRWLGETRSPIGRRIRRLQSEAQLVFHAHPVNEAREARGEPVVNSFWLSGCGRAPGGRRRRRAERRRRRCARRCSPATGRPGPKPGSGSTPTAIARADRDDATLTLCGERSAARFETRPQGLLQRLRRRWQAAEAHAVLESL